MTTIQCPQCKNEFELNDALRGQIETQVLEAEHRNHAAELAKVQAEANERAIAAAADAKRASDAALAVEKGRLASELQIEKNRLQSETQSAPKAPGR